MIAAGDFKATCLGRAQTDTERQTCYYVGEKVGEQIGYVESSSPEEAKKYRRALPSYEVLFPDLESQALVTKDQYDTFCRLVKGNPSDEVPPPPPNPANPAADTDRDEDPEPARDKPEAPDLVVTLRGVGGLGYGNITSSASFDQSPQGLAYGSGGIDLIVASKVMRTQNGRFDMGMAIAARAIQSQDTDVGNGLLEDRGDAWGYRVGVDFIYNFDRRGVKRIRGRVLAAFTGADVYNDPDAPGLRALGGAEIALAYEHKVFKGARFVVEAFVDVERSLESRQVYERSAWDTMVSYGGRLGIAYDITAIRRYRQQKTQQTGPARPAPAAAAPVPAAAPASDTNE